MKTIGDKITPCLTTALTCNGPELTLSNLKAVFAYYISCLSNVIMHNKVYFNINKTVHVCPCTQLIAIVVQYRHKK